MTKLLKTTILALAMLAGSTAANATAYKVTIDGKSNTVCYAATAAWQVYNAASEGETAAQVTKLDKGTKASDKCLAEKAAKKASKVATTETEEG